jgi:putative transposase
MQFEENNIYHIYNRGNNSQKIFFNHQNYLFFLKKIRAHILPHADVLAWCLMPNHFHLMVYLNSFEIEVENSNGESKDKYGVKWGTCVNKRRDFHKSIAVLLRSYTRAINNQENRTGSLFQMKTKAKCLTDNSEITPAWFQSNFGTIVNIEDPERSYPQVCFNYIHLNPVSGKLVENQEDWEFSSCRDFSGLRNGTLVCESRVEEFGLKLM